MPYFSVAACATVLPYAHPKDQRIGRSRPMTSTGLIQSWLFRQSSDQTGVQRRVQGSSHELAQSWSAFQNGKPLTKRPPAFASGLAKGPASSKERASVWPEPVELRTLRLSSAGSPDDCQDQRAKDHRLGARLVLLFAGLRELFRHVCEEVPIGRDFLPMELKFPVHDFFGSPPAYRGFMATLVNGCFARAGHWPIEKVSAN